MFGRSHLGEIPVLAKVFGLMHKSNFEMVEAPGGARAEINTLSSAREGGGR